MFEAPYLRYHRKFQQANHLEATRIRKDIMGP